MGSHTGKNNERPVHTVYLDAFYMDIYEVTNAQYKAFIDAKSRMAKRKYCGGISRRCVPPTLGGKRLSRRQSEPSGHLCQLVRSNGLRRMGRKAITDRGGMGESSARRVSSGKPTRGAIHTMQPAQTMHEISAHRSLSDSTHPTATGYTILLGTSPSGALMNTIPISMQHRRVKTQFQKEHAKQLSMISKKCRRRNACYVAAAGATTDYSCGSPTGTGGRRITPASSAGSAV